jgi:hypothetical protein
VGDTALAGAGVRLSELKSASVTAFHDDCLAAADWARSGAERHRASLWQAIEANHRCNCLLWEEEDLARRKHAPDSEIAGNKRAIDVWNQKRNDAIERVDEALLTALAGVARKPDARLYSETAGAMIDRLSILALKIHFMALQTRRRDVGGGHIEACKAKLARLKEQRDDLAECLDRLLGEAERGEAWFKVYRQHKMYNDPELNPAVYGERR